VAGAAVTVSLQQLLEVQQRRKGDLGFTQRHTRARCRIQHPLGNGDYDTGEDLYVNNGPARALLAIEPTERAAMQRMPSVVNHDFLPDMGRMFGDWPLAARTGCSPGRCVPANAPPPS